MATQSTMMAAMASTTKAMAVTNANMNVNQIQSMMQAYSKESMKMEMGADMGRYGRQVYS